MVFWVLGYYEAGVQRELIAAGETLCGEYIHIGSFFYYQLFLSHSSLTKRKNQFYGRRGRFYYAESIVIVIGAG